jgi:hypothetical protein
MKMEYQNRSGEYEKSYGGSSYNKDERSHYTIRKEGTAPPKARRVKPQPSEDAGGVSEETPDQQMTQKMKRMKTIYKKLFMAWLFLFLLSNVFTCIMNDDSLDEDVQSEETMDDPWGWDDEDLEEDLQPVPADEDANDAVKAAANDVTNAATNDVSESHESETESTAIAPKDKDEPASDDDLSTLDALERSTHAEVVKEAKRRGVSTKGSTLDIMERINHKEMENMKR